LFARRGSAPAVGSRQGVLIANDDCLRNGWLDAPTSIANLLLALQFLCRSPILQRFHEKGWICLKEGQGLVLVSLFQAFQSACDRWTSRPGWRVGATTSWNLLSDTSRFRDELRHRI